MNLEFVKKAQDLSRSKMTAKQMKEICNEWEKEFGERIYNPFLRLKGNVMSIPNFLLLLRLQIAEIPFEQALMVIGTLQLNLCMSSY